MINVKMASVRIQNKKSTVDDKRSPMQLIKEIAQMSDEASAECGERNGLCETDRMIILETSEKEGRTQVEIGHAVRLKKPTVSVAIKRLEREGLIYRKADEFDHRAIRVYLTDEGKAAERTIRQKLREQDNIAIKNLTTNERTMLTSLLKKVHGNIAGCDDTE